LTESATLARKQPRTPLAPGRPRSLGGRIGGAATCTGAAASRSRGNVGCIGSAATCISQNATCILLPATCISQNATCILVPATRILLPATCSGDNETSLQGGSRTKSRRSSRVGESQRRNAIAAASLQARLLAGLLRRRSSVAHAIHAPRTASGSRKSRPSRSQMALERSGGGFAISRPVAPYCHVSGCLSSIEENNSPFSPSEAPRYFPCTSQNFERGPHVLGPEEQERAAARPRGKAQGGFMRDRNFPGLCT